MAALGVPLAGLVLALLALTAATLAALARGLALEVGGPSPPGLGGAWAAARAAARAGPLSAPPYDGILRA